MSRKGHYNGGSTNIGREDSSWFKKGSTRVPRDVSGPRPPRSAQEQVEYDRMKKEQETGTWLIKASEKAENDLRRLSKRQRRRLSARKQPPQSN